MATFHNFYETHKEAVMRLRGTVVLYDKLPYWVLAVTAHNKDGIFRIYLDPVGAEKHRTPPCLDDYGPEHPAMGEMLDNWLALDEHQKTPILRKQMNSPLFNKYRPFPLGMYNAGKRCLYLERQPLRPKTEQGLTRGMISETLVSLGPPDFIKSGRGGIVEMMSAAMKACILAEHPSAEECLQNLRSGEYENEAVAFHREFAFLKGPLDMIFLAYKSDIVGVLPKNNFDYVRLGGNFRHCREVVQQLGLFSNITE